MARGPQLRIETKNKRIREKVVSFRSFILTASNTKLKKKKKKRTPEVGLILIFLCYQSTVTIINDIVSLIKIFRFLKKSENFVCCARDNWVSEFE